MKFTCICGNVFEDKNDIDAIETQWTKFAGCDSCNLMLPIEETPKEIIPVELINRKNKF